MKNVRVEFLNQPNENYSWMDFVGKDVANMGDIKVKLLGDPDSNNRVLHVQDMKAAVILGDYMVRVLLCENDCTKQLAKHVKSRGNIIVN